MTGSIREALALGQVGRIVFDNPNEPEQPASGVYRWYIASDGSEVSVYVGCAGARRRRVAAGSTLARGISEARRSCLSSDQGLSLDTDFIVGTALRFLKARGRDCHWQHISDDPRNEGALCGILSPMLQGAAAVIESQYRLRRERSRPWSELQAAEAEEALFAKFERNFRDYL